MQSSLILKRASASRASGEWNDDDFDVLADGVVVGRIFALIIFMVVAGFGVWMFGNSRDAYREPTPIIMHHP